MHSFADKLLRLVISTNRLYIIVVINAFNEIKSAEMEEILRGLNPSLSISRAFHKNTSMLFGE